MPDATAPDGVELWRTMEFSLALIVRLDALIDSGPFEVHVDRVFPLDEAALAHQALGEHHLGKIALRLE